MANTAHVYHQTQHPMVCEALNDGTGRWRCVPEVPPTPLWLSILLWGIIVALVLVPLSIWAYQAWEFRRWERDFRKKKP